MHGQIIAAQNSSSASKVLYSQRRRPQSLYQIEYCDTVAAIVRREVSASVPDSSTAPLPKLVCCKSLRREKKLLYDTDDTIGAEQFLRVIVINKVCTGCAMCS